MTSRDQGSPKGVKRWMIPSDIWLVQIGGRAHGVVSEEKVDVVLAVDYDAALAEKDREIAEHLSSIEYVTKEWNKCIETIAQLRAEVADCTKQFNELAAKSLSIDSENVRLREELETLKAKLKTAKQVAKARVQDILELEKELETARRVREKLKEYLELFNEHHPRCECSCMDHRGLKKEFEAEISELERKDGV